MWSCSPTRALLVLAATALVGCAAPRSPAPASAPPPAPVADAAPAGPEPAPAGTSAEASAERPPEAPGPAVRTPYDPAAAGLAVTTPRGWSRRRQDLALVYAGRMRVPSVVLFEPRAATLEDAVAGLADELEAPLGRVQITRAATPTAVAGYAAYVAEGTGRAEGFPMRWRATIVDGRRLTIVLGLAPTFLWGPNASAVRAFERGLRAAPAAGEAP